ncbi:hemolysin family protein [Nocardioides marmoribigeumensis]|uniref:CBS domain containing-hemolysin-like protein n=1 Tax=Nocardioides marmoribigeumensis TaxID=433649 RepID=A0ABU2BU85_9ACTN|nr:hemolysin family protein [Nocardioides marmoribigeumensis]MDR7362187.1 CBS domain containing-hemolysin-like protein [Nocardioides marmoribigeumensis]
MTWVLLGTALLLVLACGGFVAAEFAFVTVDRATVDRRAAEGDAAAQGVQQALRTLSTQLSGAQVGITVTNLAIGFLAEPAIARLIEGPLADAGVGRNAVHGVALAVGLVSATLLTMLFGELVPKNLAIAHPLGTARATQRYQRTFTTLAAIPIRVLNGAANALVRRLGIEPQEELRSARNAGEFASLAARSASEGTLDAETAGLVQRSVAFGDRTAGEIMTPRVRMEAVRVGDTALDVIALARSSGRSRFPVLGREADDVAGVVHVKHAVAVPRVGRSRTKVRDLMVDVATVPETLQLDPLLARLRDESFQLAVVVDEYGGTAGMVTVEDVVEEIVGEISDEHDSLDAVSRPHADGTWTLSGLLRPDEIAGLTRVALPAHEDYDTLGGLVLRELGRIPEAGDAVEVPLPLRVDEDGEPHDSEVARLTVVRMDGLRVDKVRLEVLPGAHGRGDDRG